MRLNYDQDADALYVKLVEGERVSRTEQIDRGTLVDLDRMGRVLGIEILRPARRWPLSEIVERYTVPEATTLERFFGNPQSATFPFAKPDLVKAASASK